MANDDQRRKNFWDDEEEEDLSSARNKPGAAAGPAPQDSAALDQKINDARVLMDQTHQLYLQYFNGTEKRTPIEKLKLLESKINELQRLGSNVTAAKFRISQFLSQYSQMKELWDRKLRERERK
jgi:hypothetical protein